MSDETSKKLAVLIDADNAQASLCNELFSEVSKYGLANVKRAYGDWTTTNLKGWKEHLHKHAIQPIQQFSYTTGKNSTDSSLIIDAMDLLHDGNLDGFCLISSDSDFTRLANRLRESGIIVYGFGEEKTPDAFISACNLFIKTENLRKTKAAKDFSDDKDLKELISNALSATSKEVAIKWSAAPDMTPQTVLYRRPVAQFSNFQPKIVSSWLILALFQANFLISGRSRLCPYQLVNSNQVRQGE